MKYGTALIFIEDAVTFAFASLRVTQCEIVQSSLRLDSSGVNDA